MLKNNEKFSRPEIKSSSSATTSAGATTSSGSGADDRRRSRSCNKAIRSVETASASTSIINTAHNLRRSIDNNQANIPSGAKTTVAKAQASPSITKQKSVIKKFF